MKVMWSIPSQGQVKFPLGLGAQTWGLQAGTWLSCGCLRGFEVGVLSAVVRMETGRLSRLWRTVSRREKLLGRARERAMHALKVQNNGCGSSHPSLPPAMNRAWIGWSHLSGITVLGSKSGIGTGLSGKTLKPGCPCPTSTEFLAALALPS